MLRFISAQEIWGLAMTKNPCEPEKPGTSSLDLDTSFVADQLEEKETYSNLASVLIRRVRRGENACTWLFSRERRL